MATAMKAPSDYKLNLELNKEEAEQLRKLTGKITNDGPISDIFTALSKAGVGDVSVGMYANVDKGEVVSYSFGKK